jgi:hypothetical protein
MKNRETSSMESSEDFPKILYKYRSLSGQSYEYTHDIFLRNELYFPHPEQINDPFDCRNPPSFDNVTKEDIISLLEQCESKYNINLNAQKQAVFSNPLETSIEAIKKQNAKGNLQNIGVLSISSEKLNILMWSHYADYHKGVCIGFDYTKLVFLFNGKHFPASEIFYPILISFLIGIILILKKILQNYI